MKLISPKHSPKIRFSLIVLSNIMLFFILSFTEKVIVNVNPLVADFRIFVILTVILLYKKLEKLNKIFADYIIFKEDLSCTI
jgi:hypothetical protein